MRILMDRFKARIASDKEEIPYSMKCSEPGNKLKTVRDDSVLLLRY